jgi:hypothetical protein
MLEGQKYEIFINAIGLFVYSLIKEFFSGIVLMQGEHHVAQKTKIFGPDTSLSFMES